MRARHFARACLASDATRYFRRCSLHRDPIARVTRCLSNSGSTRSRQARAPNSTSCTRNKVARRRSGYLGSPVGYYYSEIGPLNQVMTLWFYPSLNDRVERRERLFNDPEWISFLEQGASSRRDSGNAHPEARALLPRPPQVNSPRIWEGIAMSKLVRAALLALGACAALAAASPAAAQADYPSKPSSSCAVCGRRRHRHYRANGGQKIRNVLGQQIVVQNQGGAGGAIATAAVIKGRSRRLHAALSLDHGHRAFGDHSTTCSYDWPGTISFQ